MLLPLETLRRMAYPGRLIAIGRDPSGESNVIVYVITGRSPSSQARRLEREGAVISVRATDSELLKTGQEDLLVYPSVLWGEGLAVSNGRQTADIPIGPVDGGPVAALEAGLRSWSYEPDAPIYTPRIAGLVTPDGRAALSVLRREGEGETLRLFAEIPFIPGRAKSVATYAGDNISPLPVFRGEPLDLELTETTPEATAMAFYGALAPTNGAMDFRVAVACVFDPRDRGGERRTAIINRHERRAP